ncbi:YaaC family protein [Fervidibacillus halotolerans]|uniref:YaaC family protein n=1 Tax=Fervidibacillus halotolerans TaxID=2980027 RepID=A0A9E8LZT2_9BACI|nr:YaaC family protein [Fervidibacillus halotolerans]WAA12305.1 YaaC family protein [Fervidibacillus halotolerans]
MVFSIPFPYWDQLLYISSLETAQQFLWEKYNEYDSSIAQRKSYENSYKLIYHMEQGKNFFHLSEKTPLSIQPIALFYGLSFLLKGALLVTDPNYPENVKVLAHGVSTRKRKKQDFIYLKDEIKIQKNGFFPHFSKKMFHMEQLEGKKIKIFDLMSQIPEMSPFFKKRKRIVVSYVDEKNVRIPDDVFDSFHMTPRRFFEFLGENSNKPSLFQMVENGMTFTVDRLNPPFEVLPFRFNIKDQQYYYMEDEKGLFLFRELMIHYLLLYHLSILARYEIEWWVELFSQKSTIDYPLIYHYLRICLVKCPLLIQEYLFDGSNIVGKG